MKKFQKQKTNRRLNVKFLVQRMMTVMMTLMLALAFVACAKDTGGSSGGGDNDGGNNGGGTGGALKFSPPQWIQGSWSNNIEALGLKFTSNDIFTNDANWKETYQNSEFLTYSIQQQESTADSYKVVIKLVGSYPGGYTQTTTITHTFTKIDGTHMRYCDKTSDDSTEKCREMTKNTGGGGGGTGGNISFSPPQWIQGVWATNPEAPNAGPFYKFTSNDILYGMNKNDLTSYKELYKNALSCEEEGLETSFGYGVIFKVEHDYEIYSEVYSFTKIDDTTMRLNRGGYGGQMWYRVN